MRYMGGKSRISKALSEVILANSENRIRYIEPFVGGGAMAARMGQQFDRVTYSDIHPDLMMMWDAVLNHEWVPPTEVSYEQYQELRYTTTSSALRGFVGFGGSFGGRWFEGYARGGNNADGTPRNHQGESARALIKDAKTMRGQQETVTLCADAMEIEVVGNEVIYCDPPYANTKNYSKTGGFDHARFWKTAQGWAEAGAKVYVSEYAAPDGWSEVWSQSLRSTVRVGSEERHVTTEKLFTLRENIA